MNYRVYYNRTAEAPQIWSADEGQQTSEINVIEFHLHGIHGVSHYDPSVKPNPDTPTAWIEILHATMEVRAGVAYFYPIED